MAIGMHPSIAPNSLGGPLLNAQTQHSLAILKQENHNRPDDNKNNIVLNVPDDRHVIILIYILLILLILFVGMVKLVYCVMVTNARYWSEINWYILSSAIDNCRLFCVRQFLSLQ